MANIPTLSLGERARFLGFASEGELNSAGSSKKSTPFSVLGTPQQEFAPSNELPTGKDGAIIRTQSAMLSCKKSVTVFIMMSEQIGHRTAEQARFLVVGGKTKKAEPRM